MSEADEFYAELKAMVDELLEDFHQGTVELVRPTQTVADVTRPWDVEIGEDPETFDLRAAVSTVKREFVDGTRILASDKMVVFRVPETTPVETDQIRIDGKLHRTRGSRKIPEAGLTLAWVFFVRA